METEIDEAMVLRSVRSNNRGANVLFVGTTREMTGQRQTDQLDYEAYVPMAIEKMNQIAQQAAERWPGSQSSVVHRIGNVPIGESSIAVAVGSPHRAAAFEAAAWIMEQVKRDVPIWKRETFAGGKTEWIHPDRVEASCGEKSEPGDRQ